MISPDTRLLIKVLGTDKTMILVRKGPYHNNLKVKTLSSPKSMPTMLPS